MSHERALELLAIFDHFDGEYKREEVEEALTLRNELIPLLIQLLNELSSSPDSYIESDRFAHNYALALLAHFRDPSTHIHIIKAFSLSGKHLEIIWDDIVSESLQSLLCRTSGGNYDAIKALALNREADSFVRSAALEAIKLGVAQGDLSRDEAVSFFSTLFDDDTLAQPGDFFWPSLVFEALDLYPAELIDKIRELYAKDLVSEEYIPLEEIERIVEKGREKVLAKLPEILADRAPDDVHQYISWFACFDENLNDWDDEDPGDTIFEDELTSAELLLRKSQKNKKEKARKKRKQTKTSKKKNRK